MERLSGKRCLIVGGTGGIGLAAARRFVAEGASLVVAGLPQDTGSDLPARSISCDVRDPVHVELVFQTATSLLGGLDVLYHVAGISGRKLGDGPLHECSDAGWEATLTANLTSTFLTNRAAIRHFLQQGAGGVILNMASVLAFSPSPQYFDTAAYAASKGAIIALSRQAAARYANDGIRINVIAPGLVDTPMAARATQDADILGFLETKQPLAHGPIRPEDIADAAVFLCSDAARLITGVVLPVDAGWCVSP
jgi:NAD(P)-dependent dehydrogenase (short-subunit alcohol dehydrogenase family)